jgi:CxxC motif-containing protein (DUF1111 family)
VGHASDVRNFVGGTSLATLRWDERGKVVKRKVHSITSYRKTPPLFGLGLLEAIPEERIRKAADPNDTDCDGISGRVVELPKGIGRFGWKATQTSIDDFVAAAFVTELGLTSKRVLYDKMAMSSKVSERQIGQVADYIRFLSPPPPGKFGDFSKPGSEVFARIGCNKCHTAGHRTKSETRELDGMSVRAYTDLLVHDMGTNLADIPEANGIKASEFRTPPLWGVGSTGPPYLHDGRALSLVEAILAHGGEGASASREFKLLSNENKEELVRFLKSL